MTARLYEGKVDGWRMLVWKNGARVRLISRQHVGPTRRRFRKRPAAIAKLRPDTLVLDGEVFDEGLVSRVDLLGDPDADVVCVRGRRSPEH